MLLSDTDIATEMRHHNLRIEHVSDGAIGPASIDLMLSPYFWRFRDAGVPVVEGEEIPLGLEPVDVIDLRQDQTRTGEAYEVPEGEHYRLEPGEFCLASTVERFHFPAHLGGRLEGKSSLGRVGLMVHTTAGFFDPGFVGYPTLELVNVRQRPILLWPGMPVAQMSIFSMVTAATVPYGDKASAKYADQGPRPAPSKYHLNFWETR